MKLHVFKDELKITEKDLNPDQEYIIGRSQQCDIIIVHPEISRRHAKLFYKDGQWQCELLSSHGQILTSDNTPMPKLNIAHDTNFKILNFKFKFEDPDAKEDTAKIEMAPEATVALPKAEEFAEISDKTNVEPVTVKSALFRLDPQGEAYEELTLGAGIIEAGRSDECEIRLSDQKASRKHFSLQKISTGYVITDLGSTHGLSVNGVVVKKQELKSGDTIEIGKEKFLYQEINSAFENISRTTPAIIEPQNTSNMAAMRVDLRPQGGKLKPVYLALVVLLVVGIYINIQPEKKGHEASRAPTNSTLAVAPSDPQNTQLTAQQKKFLEETYNLSLSLYTSGKYDLAALEIAKIFQLVPNYKDARNIEALTQQALELKRQNEENQMAQQEQKDLHDRVNNILDECEQKYRAKRYGEVQSCVEQITEMDPSNPRASKLVEDAQMRMDEIQNSQEAAREAKRRLMNAQFLFEKGQKSLKERKYAAAISEFTNVTRISFNDKTGIKQKAEEGIRFAKEKMRQEALISLNEAKAALDAKDYKKTIIKINQAVKVGGPIPEAMELKSKALSELRIEMKNIYSESVIEENLGNIEAAKKKWKLILEQDIPTDDYYEKAKSKLSKYER